MLKQSQIFKVLLLFFLFSSYLIAKNWRFDNSPTRQNLARLDMTSDSTGLAVSYDGLILRYQGNQWTVFDSLRSKYPKIYSQLDTMGILGASTGDIYTVHIPQKHHAWLALNNPNQKIFLVLKYNLKTKKITSYKLPLKVRSMDLSNEAFGMAVGEGGAYIFEKGRWRICKLPVSVDFKKVKFVDSTKVVMCGDKGTLIEGDGRNWRIIPTNVNTILRDFHFISPDEGWIVGYNGTVLHYKDGIIKQEIAETLENIWAVQMLSESVGYAVGEHGTLLKYNGEFWDKIDLNTDVDIHDLEMVGEGLGFAVGARGSILKYSLEGTGHSTQHFFLFSDQVHLGSSYLMDRIDDVHGVTFAYLNNDSQIDAYLTCTKSLNHLLLNQKDGYYNDYVIESGTGGNIETRIGKLKYEYGALAADFDRDSDTDLFLAGKRQTSRYYVNNGAALFEDESQVGGIPDNLNIIDGAIGDLNEDGYPDMVLADTEKGLRLLVNKKYNNFKEYEWPVNLKIPLFGIKAVKVGDLNGDDHQDIIVAFQQTGPLLFFNDGELHWKKEPLYEPGRSYPQYINSISIADMNCDGYNDIYLCTENGKDALRIYDQQSDQFKSKTSQWNVKLRGRSYAAVPADFDLNGTVDLFVTRYGPDLLYLNQNHQSFTEEAQELVYSKSGYLDGFNSGAAVGDVDNNHTPDLIVGNKDYWSSILQNQKKHNQLYLAIKLNGLQDTKEALGAKIWIWNADKKHTAEHLLHFKEVILNYGLFSQIAPQHFFYFSEPQNVDVKVRFLDGTIKRFANVELNQTLKVDQDNYFNRSAYNVARSVLQFLHIPEMFQELLKFIFFIAFILMSVRFIEIRYQWRTSHTVAYVLAVIPVYALVSYALKETGGFADIFPFVLLAFALTVVIVVNEPIRKANHIDNYKQERTNQAVMHLSKTTVVDDAFTVVKDTLGIIHPYDQLLFYAYMKSGNSFICKHHDGLDQEEKPPRVVLKRNEVDVIRAKQSYFYYEDIRQIWPPANFITNRTLFFPLLRKNRFHGVILLNPNRTTQSISDHDLSIVQYLLLQFTIALDNIKIMQDLNEQEKLGALGTFASGIIHNLKNPIDGLRMMIEMLDQEIQENDPRKEYIAEISSGVKNLKERLVHSFDFLQGDTSGNGLVDINEILTQILKTYNNEDTLSPFEWQCKSNTALVRGNFLQIKNALENVIQNAVEASNLNDKIQIVSNVDQKNNLVEIVVRDNGHGIGDAHLDKIFNMFYSTRGKNRGLGLALTKNIIKNHNGYIDVISELDKGTEFKIALPVCTE